MDIDHAKDLLERIAASAGKVDETLVPQLDAPEDLVAFHRALAEKAEVQTALEIVGPPAQAATRIQQIWCAWRAREHAGPDIECVANHAFAAVVQALRPVARAVTEQWFDVADTWIAQLRMIAEQKY